MSVIKVIQRIVQIKRQVNIIAKYSDNNQISITTVLRWLIEIQKELEKSL